MPARQKEWAKVEWDFIRFDDRYGGLPPDLAQAYIHLWITCPNLRRDCFDREYIKSGRLADRCGIAQPIFERMIEACVTNGLLTRDKGGSITVEGVRAKHRKLRGWNAAQVRHECGMSAARLGPREGEGEREGEKSTPQPPNGDVEWLVELYRTEIKNAGDGSRFQARKNVAKLLAAGLTKDVLERCVRRYAQENVALGRTDPQFHKNAGNFFGREEVYRTYLPDDWDAPPPREELLSEAEQAEQMCGPHGRPIFNGVEQTKEEVEARFREYEAFAHKNESPSAEAGQ